MGRRCGLFARKFTRDGAAALLPVMEAMDVIPRAGNARGMGGPEAVGFSTYAARGRVKH